MRRLYDFECPACGELFEKLVHDDVKHHDCVVCGKAANRLISPVRIPDNLMSDNWARKRERHSRWKAKREEH